MRESWLRTIFADVAEQKTDTALMAAWQAGDAAAGEALFERHYARLARFFRSKAGEDYPDLVQRTFLALVEGRNRLEDPARFRSYLFAVAYNQLFAHFRRRDRTLAREVLVTKSAADLGPSPLSHVRQREQERQLLGALRELPLPQQVAIELHLWEGLTAAEIGEVLQIPLGTAKTRLRQARKKLEVALSASLSMAQDSQLDLKSWARRVRDQLEGSDEHV